VQRRPLDDLLIDATPRTPCALQRSAS
jgi:hypothetical protein